MSGVSGYVISDEESERLFNQFIFIKEELKIVSEKITHLSGVVQNPGSVVSLSDVETFKTLANRRSSELETINKRLSSVIDEVIKCFNEESFTG